MKLPKVPDDALQVSMIVFTINVSYSFPPDFLMQTRVIASFVRSVFVINDTFKRERPFESLKTLKEKLETYSGLVL
jgi:hypothetical protein